MDHFIRRHEGCSIISKGILYLNIGVADRHWFQDISYGYDTGGGGGGES